MSEILQNQRSDLKKIHEFIVEREKNEFKYSDLPMQYGDDRTVLSPGMTGLY